MAAATVDNKLQFYIWTGQKGSNLRSQLTLKLWHKTHTHKHTYPHERKYKYNTIKTFKERSKISSLTVLLNDHNEQKSTVSGNAFQMLITRWLKNACLMLLVLCSLNSLFLNSLKAWPHVATTELRLKKSSNLTLAIYQIQFYNT